VEEIDQAMTRWGFPVGPVTLMDEVGLDVAIKAGGVMREALGERLEPAIRLDALVKAGRLGRKSGKGFFQYEDGKRAGVGDDVLALLGLTRGTGPGADEITRRLTMALLNEAARACEEGVVRQPRDGDIGAIFGFGYPPFRGGPLRTLDAMGAASAVAALEDLASKHGARFAPAAILSEMARSGGRFYPAV
jgi:3-hydroxyacyl-CoA dehydrogenase/enoyl-CoA hydratase/3-hydroxybutyryl-CoA epimerase